MGDGDKNELGMSDRRELGVSHGELYLHWKVKKKYRQVEIGTESAGSVRWVTRFFHSGRGVRGGLSKRVCII